MTEGQGSFLAKLKRPRIFIPALAVLLLAGGVIGYFILLNPSGFLIRWAQAALPEQITMISLGPFPDDQAFQHLKKAKVKYIISTLDPRLPYEKDLIDREKASADKYNMTLKVFPMASVFDRTVFPDFYEQQAKAVDFLKNLDAPAYLHCYLGKHRTHRIRQELIKAGVPQRYFVPTGNSQEYWELVNRFNDALTEFDNGNFPKVLEILAPITAKDVDISYMRGWSHYRLHLISEATEDFRRGLEVEPNNPRNLSGLGYCYLRTNNPVMAQRQFNAVLEQIPDEQGALVGLGLAYLALQNKGAAAETFRKVLQLNPAHEEAKDLLKKAESP